MNQNVTLSPMTVSNLGLKVIKAYEGFRAEVSTLVTGQRVIGYGHIFDNAEEIELTRSTAEELLKTDLQPYESLVARSVMAPINQSQFDALCSLAFNIGEEKFLNCNVLHALNNGRLLDAAAAFDEWRKADIGGQIYVVDALMRRRTAEKALFLRHDASILNAGRADVVVQSDGSYQPVSEDMSIFDPDSGIVDLVPHDANPAPSRRREDGPLGILTLSEVAPRTVFDPQTETVDEDANLSETDALGESAEIDVLVDALSESDVEPEYVFDSKDIDAVNDLTDVHESHLLDIPHPNNDILDAPDIEGESVDTGIEQPINDEAAQNVSQPSLIAIAAAEVSERLDALIDTARLEPLQSDASPVPIEAVNVKDREQTVKTASAIAANSNHGQLRRADAQFTNGADAYIQKTKAVPHAANGQSAMGTYALFMFIGGCLTAAGLVTWVTNRAGLDDLTSLLVPMAVVTGAMMIIGSLYYMGRAALRRS